ncbi:transposase [Bradyrhizobium sp. F1.13.1]
MDFYARVDVSLKTMNVCVVDGDGNVGREAKHETDPDAIELSLAEWGIHLKRAGVEAFSSSGWPFTALTDKGLPMICIKSRHTKAALNAILNKTHRNDAKGIAQMMRTGWLRAVLGKSESAQTLRALPVGRETMRGKVQDMENMIRSLLRPSGLKVGEISVGRFDTRVRDLLAGKKELEAIVAPLLDARNAMRLQLANLHRMGLTAARSDSAERRMRTAPGVGALVALTFRATVNDPRRFKKSTNVGAHCGLTPRRFQSGQTEIGSISNCGDELTRAMLYEAAIAILTRIPKNFKPRL